MMNKLFKIFSSILLFSYGKVSFAVDDAGILAGSGDACLTAGDLRNGNVHLEDIPCMIKGMIDIFMGFAATIAVIFVIVGAYQIISGPLSSGSKEKGKNTIIMALGGFALAAFSWIIIRFILDNFS